MVRDIAGERGFLNEGAITSTGFKVLIRMLKNPEIPKDLKIINLFLLYHHGIIDFAYVEQALLQMGYIKDPEKLYDRLEEAVKSYL